MITAEPETGAIEPEPAAYKRPGLVLVYYGFRLACASLIAFPFAVLLGRAVGSYPRGDAVLFDPGGALLIEALRRSSPALPPLGLSAIALFVLASFVGLMPLASLIASLGVRGRVTLGFLGARALRPIGVFALLLGVSVAAQVVLALVVIVVTGVVARAPSFNDRESDLAWMVGAAIAILLGFVIGILHDLARVAAVRFDLGLRASLACAWSAVRRAPLAVLGAWGSRAALGAGALSLGMVVGAWIGVERPMGLVLGALVHQSAVLAAVFLRASWLAWALRCVGAVRSPSVAADAAVSEAPAVAATDDVAAFEAAPELPPELPVEAPGAPEAVPSEAFERDALEKVEHENSRDA